MYVTTTYINTASQCSNQFMPTHALVKSLNILYLHALFPWILQMLSQMTHGFFWVCEYLSRGWTRAALVPCKSPFLSCFQQWPTTNHTRPLVCLGNCYECNSVQPNMQLNHVTSMTKDWRHAIMWLVTPQIKELPYLSGWPRMMAHDSMTSFPNPHQSEALCAPFLIFHDQPIGIVPDIR